MMKDFYNILGLSPDCTSDDVKEAYRKLSKKIHPGLNQGDKYFEDRAVDVKEAFQTLRDPVKRIIYDVTIKSQVSTAPTAQKKQVTVAPTPAATVVPAAPKIQVTVASAPAPAVAPAAQKKEASTATASDTAEAPTAQKLAGSQYQTRRADYRNFKRKGPGIGMTLSLVLIAAILSVYIYKSLTAEKPSTPDPTYTAAATTTTYQVVHTKHKKKHVLKSKVTGEEFKYKADTASIASTKPAPAEPKISTPAAVTPAPIKKEPAKPAIVNQPAPVKPAPVKPATDSNKSAGGNHDFLYATYVNPNVTGVINMRAYNKYNSNIVDVIPTRSKVLVLEKGDTYYRVFYKNYIGYVPKWSLQEK